MKKRMLIIGLILSAGVLVAQDIPTSQVPSVVLKQFNIDFPKAKDIDWELENDTYIVEFEQGWSKDFEVWYSSNGEKIRIEEEIMKNELPKAIISAIQTNYPSYRIDDIEKITANNTTTYKVDIEKREVEKTLFFNKDGTLIK